MGFYSERNSREERINRNGKILKTDCRFIDLPEGRICVGRGEKYHVAKKYPSFIFYPTMGTSNTDNLLKRRNTGDKLRTYKFFLSE